MEVIIEQFKERFGFRPKMPCFGILLLLFIFLKNNNNNCLFGVFYCLQVSLLQNPI